ncbi:hypothetical protein [Streptomyces olivaceoviridis]|uniref:hypothetical protein n=1 Tax=Streptomyces olivaceoviridis TaxID=1921 RepID=UPI0016763442|nr:hypothetical protein [Streptomyces olivaceoviridis]
MNSPISTPQVHVPGAGAETVRPRHEFAMAFTSSPPATRWTVAPREGAPGTTVWAELDLASDARDSAMGHQVHANGLAGQAHWPVAVSGGR